MHVLLVCKGQLPVSLYGGTERIVWYLGRELARAGHRVTLLTERRGECPFAATQILDRNTPLDAQIADDVDVVHFHYLPAERISKPYIITLHGNTRNNDKLDRNCVFISRNHAMRYGATGYVYNGLDWDDYNLPDLRSGVRRTHFHFLGKAARRKKNVRGAIAVIRKTRAERLVVLGGHRLNIKMGFRLTLSPRVSFKGMVDNGVKAHYMNRSRGLIFPVRWHEPFGLAVIESLYYGCPAFCTPYGSLPELVPPDVGFLSNSRDELKDAILNHGAYDRQYCSQYVVDMFNARTMAAGYLEKYETVLNGLPVNNRTPFINEARNAWLPWI